MVKSRRSASRRQSRPNATLARRPSVSTCLRRLAEAGELRQERRHIVLLGEPPGPDELDPQVDTKTFLSSV
jgi:hypothetical protein